MLQRVPAQVDLGVTAIPHSVFIVIHVVILAAVAVFGYRAFSYGETYTGLAFGALGLAEISYVGYHVEVTHFLLSHTVSEVLVLVAAVLIFIGVREAETDETP